jgi:hypothetical protein
VFPVEARHVPPPALPQVERLMTYFDLDGRFVTGQTWVVDGGDMID